MFIVCFIPTFVVVAKVVFFFDIPTNRYYI